MANSSRETPGPIPNPEAKPARADGTAPGRGWESKLPPTQQLNNNNRTPQPQEASPQQRATTRWSGGAFCFCPQHLGCLIGSYSKLRHRRVAPPLTRPTQHAFRVFLTASPHGGLHQLRHHRVRMALWSAPRTPPRQSWEQVHRAGSVKRARSIRNSVAAELGGVSRSRFVVRQHTSLSARPHCGLCHGRVR